MSKNDDEIERINKKKFEEMLALQQKGGAKADAAPASDGRPIVLTDESFTSEVTKHPLMVVDFWAAWCGPCRMVAPIIEQLAEEYKGKVAFGKLNVDENGGTAMRFNIRGIPTLLLFKGGRIVEQVVGATGKAQLQKLIENHL